MKSLVQLDPVGSNVPALQGTGFLLYAPPMAHGRVPRLVLNLSGRTVKYQPKHEGLPEVDVLGANIASADHLDDWLKQPPEQPRLCDRSLPFKVLDFLANPWGSVMGMGFPALFSASLHKVEVVVIADEVHSPMLMKALGNVVNTDTGWLTPATV